MIKSVKQIAPSLLLPTEAIATGERLDELIAPAITNDAFVTAELAALNTSLTSLKSAVQSNRIGPYTASLAAKDDARTSALRDLVSMLQGISGVQANADNKTAADYLLALVGRQGNRVSNLSYTRKTGAFASILESFSGTQAQAYITQLGLTNLVAAFTTAQNNFETVHQTKMKADGQQPGAFAKSQTAEVCYHIINLVQYVDAQAQRDATFQSLVPSINSTVADIMAKARARKTRSLDANATPTPAPASTTTTTNTTSSTTATTQKAASAPATVATPAAATTTAPAAATSAASTSSTEAKAEDVTQPSNVVPITQNQEVTAKAA